MIYESAFVLRTEAGEEAIKKITDIVSETISNFDGEILVNDNWGVKQFAQPTEAGVTRGNYFYIMYKANTNCNTELERRFKISEDVLKFLFIRLGVDADQEAIVKGYSNPFNATGDDATETFKDKKQFAKRKSCYFTEKKTRPDWKNTNSYAWLVNEFGKISPARVTGLRPKYQRAATTAIKRGRCIGLISYMNNHVAR
ncbi:MAG: 30S ribosomal protein S18 [Bacteriovoracaceae bacterium]|jgi:ribosomal protein S18/ribosomal protein S6|nr:30S ribosomal protein S18 [Bacteriovoracaceae bacterium]